MSALDLGERVGTSHQQIYRLERGQRRLTTDWMNRIAAALGVDPADLLSRQASPASPLPLSLDIPVIGEVQAGIWKMGFEWADDAREIISIAPPGEVKAQYFGLRVVGDSMDLVYPPGTILICVGTLDYWGEIQNGEHVIVQRRSTSGDECEYTVKELQQDKDGVFWLVPRSSNPAHQGAIRCHNLDTDMPQAGNGDIEIIAVVVGEQRWRRRP